MRKVCKKQKLAQTDPHIATGLNRTFISDLESGIQGPSFHTVIRAEKGWKSLLGHLSRIARDRPNLSSLPMAGDLLPAVYGY